MQAADYKKKREAVELPLGNRFIKFTPISMYRHGDKQRRVFFLWLALCAIIIPSGSMTRIFEWTGIAVNLGSLNVYLTLYLPMLFCVALVMWVGFWWAAIPAYFSTFGVAILGGMPLEWVIIFSLANPIGLAMYAMFYRVTPLRTDLGNLESLVGFAIIALVASLAGSIGAFIWALTNDVGLTVAHRVWLGWWLGGWLQTILIVAPILYFFGAKAEHYLASLKNSYLHLNNARASLAAMISSFFTILVCFVGASRLIGVRQIETVNWSQGESMGLEQAQNIVDTLSYPLIILITVMMALSYLAYRAVIFWHTAMQGVNEKLSDKNDQLVSLVNRDPLTGLFNRRKIFEQLAYDFNRATRASESFSVIMVDADKFKSVNDTYGHLVGDQVIKSIAQKIQQCLRECDTAGRYGGEEFIALLPSTSLEQALIVANRIRDSIVNQRIKTDSGVLKVTVSLGVATLNDLDPNGESTIDRADQALLRAKDKGRNRVEY